jgi:hypothetical protein
MKVEPCAYGPHTQGILQNHRIPGELLAQACLPSKSCLPMIDANSFQKTL